eukprot:scaffold11744_cov117-Isochrysis_galbana.AAC.1
MATMGMDGVAATSLLRHREMKNGRPPHLPDERPGGRRGGLLRAAGCGARPRVRCRSSHTTHHPRGGGRTSPYRIGP